MDATQFGTFMNTFTDMVKDLVNAQQKTTGANVSTPKISVKIPTYKGEPGENVVVWLRQVKNLFHAQGLKDEGIIIHYAATGLEDAALHWFVNKVKDT